MTQTLMVLFMLFVALAVGAILTGDPPKPKRRCAKLHERRK